MRWAIEWDLVAMANASPRLRRRPPCPILRSILKGHRSLVGSFAPLSGGFSLTRDHSVCFPDGAAFVTGPFQAFVGDFRPEFLKRVRCRLVRVPFGVIRCPGHLI